MYHPVQTQGKPVYKSALSVWLKASWLATDLTQKGRLFLHFGPMAVKTCPPFDLDFRPVKQVVDGMEGVRGFEIKA